jgi:transketolase
MSFTLGPRRGRGYKIPEVKPLGTRMPAAEEIAHFETLDRVYRALCAVLYNYVPQSGHPGGSISSGRFVAGILYDAVDLDLSNPLREDADIVSYAAGHKALGLYAMWALRNEVARIAAPELLPRNEKHQLRLEDLLGFRRNPTAQTPLFLRHRAKALDGHPTPGTPFVRLSTGASGVGVASSFGLAWGARDRYGADAPRVHVVEGEGGLTPGRVAEALAAAGTASLDNVIVHLDWNQASIDSNRVCRAGEEPGDYVQWTPGELFALHDWNVIEVADGKDFGQVLYAQRLAASLRSTQPTAIVYSTVKGWQYGIEGRTSHGAGHALCSQGFENAVAELSNHNGRTFPSCCDMAKPRCSGPQGTPVMEACFWEALMIVREEMEAHPETMRFLGERLRASLKRLEERRRVPRADGPRIEAVYEAVVAEGREVPAVLRLTPGSSTTLRGELGRALNYLNKASGGAFLVAAADLLDSTSVSKTTEGFPKGYFNTATNPLSRTLSVGGICEDAAAGIMSGLGSFGHHIGAASSYAAFIAPLGHIAARLHAIGNQARAGVTGEPYRPMILVCAHAGLKTGEDGPTHADPQALQLFQENFPAGTSITLTPWDPAEIWTLLAAALERRPCLIAPFVTRPNEAVPDREKLGLAPVTAARTGVYRLRPAHGKGDGTVVLQGSEVGLAFATEVLPRFLHEGVDLEIVYVASAELFDALTPAERELIFPVARSEEAMGITGFTFPTLYRWIRSETGRVHSLHPFQEKHFLGSGRGEMVLAVAGLDADGQYRGVRRYLEARARARKVPVA